MSGRVSSSSEATSLASWAMCLPENGLVSPSLIIESIALASPMRNPKRACLSRYGAFDIDSIPPPTPTSRSPARIAASSSPAARMPDAHTLLIVSEEISFGMPALDLRLAGGDLPLAGLDHLAHDDVLDLLGRDLGALERGFDRGATELGGVEARESAAELADRCAGCRQDHGLGHLGSVSPGRWLTSMLVTRWLRARCR